MARILVADDDGDVRDIFVAWLSDAGHQIQQAADGEAALALALAAEFDIALLDVVMPRLGGTELIKRLRELRPDLFIIAVSGGGAGVPAEIALMASGLLGADRALIKPVQREMLLQTVDEA